MKKCDKARCQICNFVVETQKFEHNGHTYWINYSFDCDSIGVIYLLKCARCFKVYVGSTITTFRKRLNHKSSLRKYGQRIRHMAGEHLYAHFLARNTKAWPISELSFLTKQIRMIQRKERHFGHIIWTRLHLRD